MKGADEIIRKKIEAKNSLENYTYNIKNALNDEKIKDKFTSEDKEKINKIVEETVKWMEANQDAQTEEYEAKHKELEGVY